MKPESQIDVKNQGRIVKRIPDALKGVGHGLTWRAAAGTSAETSRKTSRLETPIDGAPQLEHGCGILSGNVTHDKAECGNRVARRPITDSLS